MQGIGAKVRFGNEFLAELREMGRGPKPKADEGSANDKNGGASFMDHLKESIQGVDELQKTADGMATNLATGKDANLHETMLAATQAELSFNLMVQIRNKALEAYQEIMRMQV